MCQSKRIVLILSCIIVSLAPLLASDSLKTYKFDSTVYDFGTVFDNQGKISCTFKVNNIGEEPFLIQNVATSCGCTKVTWPQKPILPKKKGIIQVEYDNNEGAHPFDKSILVKLSSEEKPILLHIRGKVLKGLEDPYEEYTFLIGPAALKQGGFSFGNVYLRNRYEGEFSVYNTCRDSIIVKISSSNSRIRFLSDGEQRISGKKVSRFFFELNTEEERYGKHVDTLHIVSKKNSSKKWNQENVLICYTLIPTPSVSNKSPVAKIKDHYLKLGRVGRREQQKKIISITNIGTGPLHIYHVDAGSDVSLDFTPTVLSPGDALDLEVEFKFNSRHKKRKNVTILSFYTDSVEQPVQHIYVTYLIKLSVIETLAAIKTKIFGDVRLYPCKT